MARPKSRTSEDTSETDIFYDGDFDADDFVETMTSGRETKERHQERPARQRVELRSEEKWLREQLSDWDDLDR